MLLGLAEKAPAAYSQETKEARAKKKGGGGLGDGGFRTSFSIRVSTNVRRPFALGVSIKPLNVCCYCELAFISTDGLSIRRAIGEVIYSKVH